MDVLCLDPRRGKFGVEDGTIIHSKNAKKDCKYKQKKSPLWKMLRMQYRYLSAGTRDVKMN